MCERVAERELHASLQSATELQQRGLHIPKLPVRTGCSLSSFLGLSPCGWLSPALCNLPAEADSPCVSQPGPATNLADHKSSVGPRHVAWEVGEEELGSCQGRNDDCLVSAVRLL